MQQGLNTPCQASSSNLPIVAIKPHFLPSRLPHTTQPPATHHTHLDRRSITAALLAIITTTPNLPVNAANVTPSSSPSILPLISSEGFSFNFPSNWVIAFDRSSSRGGGKIGDPITVVGDYSKTYATASVFSSSPPPPGGERGRRSQLTSLAQAQALCLDPIASEPGTMRFRVDKSELDSTGTVFTFQYYLETCSGEWEEGKNGELRCLNALGMDATVKKRNYIGRYIVLHNGRSYTITASVDLDKFGGLEGVLNGVVASFKES